jgi:nucleoside phosphorylase
MRVLVTFAVDAEFAPWRKRHPFSAVPIELSHRHFKESFFTAQVGKIDVVVYLTGIGWTLPEYGLRMLIAERPDVCISSGLAGGLKARFAKGDIVAARFVTSLQEGGGSVGSNTRLLDLTKECGAKVAETCITSRQILGQAQFKRAMGEFGDIVDMESFKIMQMATGPQIRAITVRAISDTVDEDMPLDFSRAVDQNGRVLVRHLALQLARYPHRLPALVRFGRNSKRAAERLADFLDRYVELIETEFQRGFPKMREQVGAR